MNGFENDIAYLVNAIFSVLSTGLFIYIIVSLLVSFQVVNSHNQLVNIVMNTLSRIYEPMLKPIRQFLPDLGGLDISPVLLFILIGFTQRILLRILIG